MVSQFLQTSTQPLVIPTYVFCEIQDNSYLECRVDVSVVNCCRLTNRSGDLTRTWLASKLNWRSKQLAGKVRMVYRCVVDRIKTETARHSVWSAGPVPLKLPGQTGPPLQGTTHCVISLSGCVLMILLWWTRVSDCVCECVVVVALDLREWLCVCCCSVGPEGVTVCVVVALDLREWLCVLLL